MTSKSVKTCSSCAHNTGGEEPVCMGSGRYVEIERQVGNFCGYDFSGYIPKQPLLTRIKNWLYSVKE